MTQEESLQQKILLLEGELAKARRDESAGMLALGTIYEFRRRFQMINGLISFTKQRLGDAGLESSYLTTAEDILAIFDVEAGKALDARRADALAGKKNVSE